jgi:hypothetical protein
MGRMDRLVETYALRSDGPNGAPSKIALSLARISPCRANTSLSVVVGGEWKASTEVTYRVRLERDNNNLLESGGVCWGDDLGICARQVLDDAAKAVTR